MSQLKIGDVAPDFSLLDQDGKEVSLASFKNHKNVLVYFYPKASTPGCTAQACGVRDTMDEFKALDTVVLGVSPDEPKALKRFVEKQGLNFTLLSDPDHKVSNAYHVWALKQFMGREYMGIIRTSFIIDKSGMIIHITKKVNTKTHHDDMLAIIKNGY